MPKLSLYAQYLKSLSDRGRPPAPRYSREVHIKRSHNFSITDEAYANLCKIAYDFGLRRQERKLQQRATADTLPDTEIGNVSLLIELIGDGVYEVVPMPLEQIT